MRLSENDIRLLRWAKKHKIRQRAYFQRPDVKARQRAYSQRPDVKARQRAYSQRPDVKARMKKQIKLAEIKRRKSSEAENITAQRKNKGCEILDHGGFPCGDKIVGINEMHLDKECHDYDKFPWVMVRVCKKHLE